MTNVISLDQHREKKLDDAIDAMLDMEEEIRQSMLLSVSKGFVDKMVNHYGVCPSFVAMDIAGTLMGRVIHELQTGDDAAKEVLISLRNICNGLIDSEGIDDSEEARERYLDAMYRHRNGEFCRIVDAEGDGGDQ